MMWLPRQICRETPVGPVQLASRPGGGIWIQGGAPLLLWSSTGGDLDAQGFEAGTLVELIPEKELAWQPQPISQA